ncbi:MAG: D-tyrosyl-tRNA(Tyr) deacylase [Deltaproteobacteria bacterium]|nr:D-tyrosyl-tRNA(Tyr) deacylase [Deltaproteobacteria bacterium]MBW2121901.1 D-tyrosyl-tRNA(Tyr) deacylase [Deltaproteobacteria bacterium]
MRAVIQRVKSARVSIEGRTEGRIERGLLVFLGVGNGDEPKDADYLASKIAGLRIFPDTSGKFSLSVRDVAGGILVVSQFTLYGDCRRGRRPSFTGAAPGDVAERLYGYFIEKMCQQGLPVESGIFQAAMEVHLVNDGPVTILLDSRKCL